MNPAPSDTPRCDAETCECRQYHPMGGHTTADRRRAPNGECVDADFARQLEREFVIQRKNYMDLFQAVIGTEGACIPEIDPIEVAQRNREGARMCREYHSWILQAVTILSGDRGSAYMDKLPAWAQDRMDEIKDQTDRIAELETKLSEVATTALTIESESSRNYDELQIARARITELEAQLSAAQSWIPGQD